MGKRKATRVSYLGPEGTYSHKIARERFPRGAVFLPHSTIAQVFESVVRGGAEFAIVPIENSSGGTVYDTVDILVDPGFPHERMGIVEELSMEVRLALLGRGEIGRIKKVYSHFAPLKHCESWIRKNLQGAVPCPVNSTTVAALAAASEDGAAAIASREAARKYGLKVLRYPLAEDLRNITQFILLGERGGRGGAKTTIVFGLRDKPGSLYEFVGVFAGRRINLTRIISRPIPGEPGQYVFLIDFQGTPSKPAVTEALREVGKHSVFVRNLGSYPVRKTYTS